MPAADTSSHDTAAGATIYTRTCTLFFGHSSAPRIVTSQPVPQRHDEHPMRLSASNGSQGRGHVQDSNL